MQLTPEEKAVFAYFANSSEAEKAAENLLNLGYNSVQVDKVSKYGNSYEAEYNNPIMGRALTGTGLSLYSASAGRGDAERVLMGADPSVSGMSAGGLAGGESYLVTVVAAEEEAERARQILKQYGANT